MSVQSRLAVLICTFSLLSFFFDDIHYLDAHVCIQSILFNALSYSMGRCFTKFLYYCDYYFFLNYFIIIIIIKEGWHCVIY